MLMFIFFFLRTRHPPRSTRPDTLFPYTPLFRSNKPYWISTPCAYSGGIDGCGQPARPKRIEVSSSAHHAMLSITATVPARNNGRRSEEHTSELQSLMRISYAVFCLKKKIKTKRQYQRQQK